MLEKQILYEFKIFNERRILNKSNKQDTSEKYYFSSCGDEFFRNKIKLDNYLSHITDKKTSYENYVVSEMLDYNFDFSKLYKEKTNSEFTSTCITFNLCTFNKIPFLYTDILLTETFSADANFHAMMYTGRVKSYKIHYVWFFFKWIKIIKYEQNPV